MAVNSAKLNNKNNVVNRLDKLRENVNVSASKNIKKDKKRIIRNKIKRIFFVLFFTGVIFSCVLTIVGLLVFAEFTKNFPDITDPSFLNPQNTENSIMYDRNGKELYKFIGDINRELVDNYKDIPDLVKYSFMLSEDDSFYEHRGVDLTAIVRCGVGSLSGLNCGGSTITQQVIKNTILAQEWKNVQRKDLPQLKLKQMILALKLETLYSKEQIMTLYVNLAPQGGNVTGIKTSAKKYFGKEMKDLTLAESAMLAGLVQNPVRFNPYSTVDNMYCRTSDGNEVAKSNVIFPKEGDTIIEDKGSLKDDKGSDVIFAKPYKCRQLYVISQFKNKPERLKQWNLKVTEDDIKTAIADPLEIKPNTIKIEAPHFVFFAYDQLTDENGEFIDGKSISADDISNKGYRIYTTIDLEMQNQAQKLVKDWVDGSSDWCNTSDYTCTVQKKGVKDRMQMYNGSLMVIDPKTGEILTMVGSKNYFGEIEAENPTTKLAKFNPKTNIATSKQQPGSSIKPISLLSGLESGKIWPSLVLPDAKMTFAGNYTPQDAENWSKAGWYFSNGPVSTNNFLRRSLQMSLNIPTVQAGEIIGVENVLSFFERMGYSTFSENKSRYGTAIMIGAGDVLPIQHVNAFASIASGGIDHSFQNAILKIEDKNGKVLWQRDTKKNAKRVLDERAAWLMTDIIYKYGETNGGITKSVYDYPIAGKTGTSDDNKDTWFVTYTPNITVGAWVGNNDNSIPTRDKYLNALAYGSNTAQPLVTKFLSKYIGNYPKTEFVKPDGIVTAKVCKVSGKLATSKCGSEVVEEKFIAGFLPPVDDTYVSATLCYDKPVSDPSAKSKNQLARDIDIQYGYAQEANYRYLKAINPKLQSVWDKALNQVPFNKENAVYCDTNYSTVTANPAINHNSPTNGQSFTIGSSFTVSGSAQGALGNVNDIRVYLDGDLIYTENSNTYSKSVTIPSTASPGTHSLTIVVTDSGGRSSTLLISINYKIASNTSASTSIISAELLDLLVPNSNSPNSINILTSKYSGLNPNGEVSLEMRKGTSGKFFELGKMKKNDETDFSYSWLAPNAKGDYYFRAIYSKGSSKVYSNISKINIT